MQLDRNQRWLSSKEFLRNEYGINANYSSNHHNYYSAWTYITKEDENFVESAGHPVPQVVLSGITNAKGKRTNESRGNEDDQNSGDDKDTDSHTSRRSASTRKRKHLTTFEVTEIIVEKHVKLLVELQALAHQ